MPTKQETFDTVVAHLRKQGKPASNDDGTCMYRTTDGLKCAVGALIPDERYTAILEDYLPCIDGRHELNDLLNELGHDIVLARELQGVHDCAGVTEWEYELEVVAAKFNLTYTPPAKE